MLAGHQVIKLQVQEEAPKKLGKNAEPLFLLPFQQVKAQVPVAAVTVVSPF